MKKIWVWIFSKLPVIKELRGYKTYLGGLMILVYYAALALMKLMVLFPEVEMMAVVLDALQRALPALEQMAMYIGAPVLVAATVDNKAKSEK